MPVLIESPNTISQAALRREAGEPPALQSPPEFEGSEAGGGAGSTIAA